MKSYSVQEINEVLKGEIVGTTSHLVTAPEQLEAASETEISFALLLLMKISPLSPEKTKLLSK